MSTMAKISAGISLASMLAVFWIVQASITNPHSHEPVSGFSIWAASPFLGALLTGLIVRNSRKATQIVLVTVVSISVLTIIGYADTLLIRPDNQSGLVVIFFPIYAHVICGIVGIIAILKSAREQQQKDSAWKEMHWD